MYMKQTKKKVVNSLLTKNIPVVNVTMSVSDIIQFLHTKTNNFESIDYIYVVNEVQELVGVVSIKQLFQHPATTVIQSIMDTNVVFIFPDATLKQAAHLALQHRITYVPVVDPSGLFLGVVVSDTLLPLIYHELTSSVLKLGGIHHAEAAYDNIMDISLWKSLKHRLPWLLIGLLGGILASHIIAQFEDTLQQNLILAAFIPLVIYIADAVETQVEAFVIRDFALHAKLQFSKYFLRQLLIVFLIGAIVSSVLFVWNIFWQDNIQIAVVISVTILCAILFSVVTGLCVPYLFRKFHLDPANGSGPVATIIQDIFSILIYFAIATWLL